MPAGDDGIFQNHLYMVDHEEEIAVANRNIRAELEAAIKSQNAVQQDWESPQAKLVWQQVQDDWIFTSNEMNTILQNAGIAVGEVRTGTQRTDGQVARYFEMPPLR